MHNSDVWKSGYASQPLSSLFCSFRRVERNKPALAPPADWNGQKEAAVSDAQGNRKIQQPRIIQSCRIPRPVDGKDRSLPAPLHSAYRLGTRYRFGLLNCGDDYFFFG
jgi:hypothetical protein